MGVHVFNLITCEVKHMHTQGPPGNQFLHNLDYFIHMRQDILALKDLPSSAIHDYMYNLGLHEEGVNHLTLF